jgi:serine phosphatase RsbU (regulator of sigma subunit)
MPPEKPQLGVEQAIDYVGRHRQEPAGRIVQGLYRACRIAAGHEPQQDDATSVVVKVL